MAKISDITLDDSIFALFKGEPKTGKTIAWASFPKPYCVDTDFRMKPLATYPPLHGKDIEYDSFSDWDSLDRKLEELEYNCPYDTIVLDSLTTLARLTINYLFKNRGNATGSAKRKGETFAKMGGIPIMDIAEYSGESSGLSQILTRLRVIYNKNRPRVNVILVAHVITSEQSTLDNKTVTSRRLVTGGNKIAAEIPGYFDEIYHFYSRQEGLNPDDPINYYAMTRATGIDFAGTSFNNLPVKIDFTNKLFYDELMTAVKNGG